MAFSEDVDRRIRATIILKDEFENLEDKDQAWQDLIRLTGDKDRAVRWNASQALESAFQHVPYKDKAWQDLIGLTGDQDIGVRRSSARSLGFSFQHVLDKDKAWQGLHSLTSDRDSNLRWIAARSLGFAFQHIHDKDQAWQDLHSLTYDPDSNVRRRAARALGSAFQHILDKDQAWQGLHRLTSDPDSNVRWIAAQALGSEFQYFSDKNQAWQDLIKLTDDQDSDVRRLAAQALGSAFKHVSDKDQARQDLHKLTINRDSNVRWIAAQALGSAFQYFSNKDQAWQDLHRLTGDQDSIVRWRAAQAIGSAFQHVPDKKQAWHDFLRLIRDQDSSVRWSAAQALGSAFRHVPDKNRAWHDFLWLTGNQDSSVRMFGYYSLGKASVLRATDSRDKNTLQRELEAAVGYFEKSAQESEYSPARFCYPFYLTYFAIIFQGGSQDAVQKYLAKAKAAVGGSESKEELLKAVENLAGALQEVQNLGNRPLQEVLRDLKAYEWYCTQAEEHMTSVEDKASGAVKLMRRCNPWIKVSIQTTINEIQGIAGQICQVTKNKGPEASAFCSRIREAAGSLSVEDLTETLRTISEFASLLKEKCELLPEGERDLMQSQLKRIDCIGAIPEKLDGIKIAVKFFLSRIQKDEKFFGKLEEMNEKMDSIHKDIKSFRQCVLDRFELSEQKILSSVLERLAKDKLEIVNDLLDAVQENRVSKELAEETLEAARDLIIELRSKQIRDEVVAKSVNSWEDAINSPELKAENKIKVTIPIIPLLLSYEGSYNFETGVKLDGVWKKLKDLVRQ